MSSTTDVQMKQIRIQSALIFVLAGCLLLALAGCNQELNLGQYEFQCDEPSDCVAPYVCDVDAQRCVLEDAGGQDATDDTTDISDISDISDTTDTIEPEDTGDTTDITDTGGDADGSTTCDCEEDEVCTDAGDCVDPVTSCDSLNDCGSGEFCQLDDTCAPLEGDSCTNHGGCSDFIELCTHDIQTSGVCSLWRCEYAGLEADCPPLGFCSRVKDSDSGVELNICLAATCNPMTSGACGLNQNCVPKTESMGTCVDTGSAQQGAPCANVSDPTKKCDAGLACVLLPGSSNSVCKKYCDPWSSSNACSTSEECAPAAAVGLAGICVRPGSVDCSARDTLPLTPCDARSVCADVRGIATCSEVCLVGEGDCEGVGEVCNPSRIPGEVGYGHCERRCQTDSDCQASGETCRTVELGSTSLKVCAQSCREDTECSENFICKEGYCD